MWRSTGLVGFRISLDVSTAFWSSLPETLYLMLVCTAIYLPRKQAYPWLSYFSRRCFMYILLSRICWKTQQAHTLSFSTCNCYSVVICSLSMSLVVCLCFWALQGFSGLLDQALFCTLEAAEQWETCSASWCCSPDHPPEFHCLWVWKTWGLCFTTPVLGKAYWWGGILNRSWFK